MLHLTLTAAYAPFALSFALMCAFGLMEFMGAGVGTFDLSVQYGEDSLHSYADASFLDWLGILEGMPVMAWTASLLGCYTVAGVGMQTVAEALYAQTIGWPLATAAAVPAAFALNMVTANMLYRSLGLENA